MASKLTEKLKVGKSVWENYVAESQKLYCVDPNMKINSIKETYKPSTTNIDEIDGNMLKLRRTYEIDGSKIEMQSGHAYYREYKGGSVSEFTTIDEAENAVLNDFSKKLGNNEIKLPHGGDIIIRLNGENLVYRPVWIEKRNMFSINYFPQK